MKILGFEFEVAKRQRLYEQAMHTTRQRRDFLLDLAKKYNREGNKAIDKGQKDYAFSLFSLRDKEELEAEKLTKKLIKMKKRYDWGLY